MHSTAAAENRVFAQMEEGLGTVTAFQPGSHGRDAVPNFLEHFTPIDRHWRSNGGVFTIANILLNGVNSMNTSNSPGSQNPKGFALDSLGGAFRSQPAQNSNRAYRPLLSLWQQTGWLHTGEGPHQNLQASVGMKRRAWPPSGG